MEMDAGERGEHFIMKKKLLCYLQQHYAWVHLQDVETAHQ